LVGCSTASGGESNDDDSGGIVPAESDAAGGETDGPDAGSTGASTPGGGDGADLGCEKVDFLFVVDNSRSMGDEQANLVSSYPAFISSIRETLGDAQDYRVMVVDTDAWTYQGCVMPCNAFGECPIAPEFQCGITEPAPCEDVLGAGVVDPKGTQASEQECGFSGGRRYIDETDQDPLEMFACAAKVGTSATIDPERPMDAMLAALSDSGEAAECNAGFVRDDAILVVTFITDENDDEGDGSSGTPEEWKTALVSRKLGNAAAIVMLGLFGDNDLDDGICIDLDPTVGKGAEASPRLRQFVESFGNNGLFGSVCEPSYDTFFQRAVDLIAVACGQFTAG
jgi:hypothetical protein